MNGRCIVNCAVGNYVGANRNTLAHCSRFCPDAELLFRNSYPPGCPAHEELMYAFKIYALAEAIAKGFRFLLWMDCSFQPIRSIEPLWNEIERTGWYVPPQGSAPLSRWCSDAALGVFGIDRAAATEIPLVYSGIVGLDIENPTGQAIWDQWRALIGTFSGAHANRPGTPMQPWGNKWEGHASYDTTVEGHRHDESALSFALYSLGLRPKLLNFLTYESIDGFIGHHVHANF